jgi:hypothetical protein
MRRQPVGRQTVLVSAARNVGWRECSIGSRSLSVGQSRQAQPRKSSAKPGKAIANGSSSAFSREKQSRDQRPMMERARGGAIIEVITYRTDKSVGICPWR